MSPTRALVAVGGVGALLALAMRRAQAALINSPAFSEPIDWQGIFAGQGAAIEGHQVQQAMTDSSANVSAFLSMISHSEGTDRGADPYRVCYGYSHTIQSFADHPAVTGEWRGESIANLGPQYAGMVSTAAGRYQIIKPTWLDCKRALDLPDFSPASQDAAAVYLIKRRGALDDVRAGWIEQAIAKCAKEWASLPGAGYGQPERKLAALTDAYTDAGGYLA